MKLHVAKSMMGGVLIAIVAAVVGTPAVATAGPAPVAPRTDVAMTPRPGPRPANLIGHAGRWITDAKGRVRIDHGFNMVTSRPPYLPSAQGFGSDDAEFLARHGFTLVRLGVYPTALLPAQGTYDEAYARRIERTVDLLGSYGVATLLDLHQDMLHEDYQGAGLPGWMLSDDGLPALPPAGFPGNYFGMVALNRAYDNFWSNRPVVDGLGPQDHLARAWSRLARRFSDNPHVLGYDLFNEPWPGSTYAPCATPAGCQDQDQAKLVPFFRRLITGVRRADPHHLVFYEPFLTFDYGMPSFIGDLGDAKAGISFHAYCTASLGAPETPLTRELCDKQVHQRIVENAFAQASHNNDALLMTEFGVSDKADETEFQHLLPYYDSISLPWTEWTYCWCDAAIGGAPKIGLVFDLRKAPKGTNVYQRRLRSLDRPHPFLVAGTPLGSAFDPTTRRFRFSYDTTGAAGTLRSSVTKIWVGRIHYRGGYRVAVQGARVISRKDGWLCLATNEGVSRVRVSIRPRP